MKSNSCLIIYTKTKTNKQNILKNLKENIWQCFCGFEVWMCLKLDSSTNQINLLIWHIYVICIHIYITYIYIKHGHILRVIHVHTYVCMCFIYTSEKWHTWWVKRYASDWKKIVTMYKADEEFAETEAIKTCLRFLGLNLGFITY